MSNELAESNVQQMQTVSTSESNSQILSIIDRVAVMKDLDMDRLDHLWNMHKENLAMEAEKAYSSAMALAQSEMQNVIKNKTNAHTRSKFADIGAVHNECKPIWTKYGFSVSSKTGSSSIAGHTLVSSVVRHSGGHKEELSNDWPLDNGGMQGKTNKTAIQAMGSTITYARRYYELMIFDIGFDEQDNDGAPQQVARVITAKDAASIKQRLESTESNVAKFCEVLGINSVDEMPLNLVAKANSMLNKKEQQNAGN